MILTHFIRATWRLVLPNSDFSDICAKLRSKLGAYRAIDSVCNGCSCLFVVSLECSGTVRPLNTPKDGRYRFNYVGLHRIIPMPVLPSVANGTTFNLAPV